MSLCILIPARWQSARFPGKMLALLADKPLLEWTYRSAEKIVDSAHIWILADDQRVVDFARSINAQVIMTPTSCPNGSSRLAWALQGPLAHYQSWYIAGLQGDEPLMPPQAIQACYQGIENDQEAVMATLACPCSAVDFHSPHVVKCLANRLGRALYFSRSPIPNPGWHKGRFIPPSNAKRHLGLYLWKGSFLAQEYLRLPASTLQQSEDLEQLAVLEDGHVIQLVDWHQLLPPGVDTPEDLLFLQEHYDLNSGSKKSLE